MNGTELYIIFNWGKSFSIVLSMKLKVLVSNKNIISPLAVLVKYLIVLPSAHVSLSFHPQNFSSRCRIYILVRKAPPPPRVIILVLKPLSNPPPPNKMMLTPHSQFFLFSIY